MRIAALLVQGSGDKTYTVDVNPEGQLRCTCPDYFYRSQTDNPARPCKHIRFAAEFIKLPANA